MPRAKNDVKLVDIDTTDNVLSDEEMEVVRAAVEAAKEEEPVLEAFSEDEAREFASDAAMATLAKITEEVATVSVIAAVATAGKCKCEEPAEVTAIHNRLGRFSVCAGCGLKK